jgi:hypothetical protein
MKMAVFWVVALCRLVRVCQRFRGPYSIAMMLEAVRASETSVNLYKSIRRYNPEDSHLRVFFIGRNAIYNFLVNEN